MATQSNPQEPHVAIDFTELIENVQRCEELTSRMAKKDERVNTLIATLTAVVFFIVGFGGCIASFVLGVLILVPAKPFTEQDVAAGVCMIVFSLEIGAVAGLVAAFVAFVIGYIIYVVADCFLCLCTRE